MKAFGELMHNVEREIRIPTSAKSSRTRFSFSPSELESVPVTLSCSRAPAWDACPLRGTILDLAFTVFALDVLETAS